MGGMTTEQSLEASLGQLADEHNAVAGQLGGTADPLLGGRSRGPGCPWVACFRPWCRVVSVSLAGRQAARTPGHFVGGFARSAGKRDAS